ncbi:MAG: MFS transporter [Promethearchaeota archaeon]
MSAESNNKNKQRTILGVSSQVFIMGLVSLFTDVSSEMIQSILPLFIFSIGGTALILGLISGVTTALSNILKGVSGWMSDKINKRKPFVVAGYAISNLSKPFIGLSPSWEFVLALKSTDRIGKGLRTSSRDALISYYAIERGKSFGFHRAMDTLGAVIGSLLAFIFLFLLWSYSQIIFFSIFPGICAIILILSVKDVDPNQFDESKLKFHDIPKVDKISKNFIKLIIILGVIEFASLDIAFLIIRAADYVSLDLIFLIPLFYLLSNIVYTCLSPINGILSDKLGRKPVILMGLSILLVTSILLAFPVQPSIFSLIIIIIIFLFYGIYMSAVDPVSRAYIADLAGKNKRGRAYGYYYLSVGIISMAESLIFGLIYDRFSYMWAFIYASIMLFISMVIFGVTDFSKITERSEVS